LYTTGGGESLSQEAVLAGIVSYPQVVEEALREFGDLLPNEPQRQHFAAYLTGLFVADRKHVCASNREFAQTTDPSCLNRFLTEAAWDTQQLNQRRLDFLPEDPAPRYSEHGVIPIDNTLIDHHGTLIEDAGCFWDHAEARYQIAHDYLFANYVCTTGKHYPLDFRRFQKAEQCAERKVPFRDHTALCLERIDGVCQQRIPGAFACDSSFTNAPILHHSHGQWLATGLPRAYGGSLKFTRNLQYRGQLLKASELAARIAPAIRKPLTVGERKQWYVTGTLRIPGVPHKVRLLILWQQRADEQARSIVVTNRVQGEASRIVRVDRHRWTGTETFHREGKQQLGRGDCQRRDGAGQTRHMYLVMLAYSLLVRPLRQGQA
jgi:Transposase DDE domain